MSLALALFALVAFVDATDNTTQCMRGCRCGDGTVHIVRIRGPWISCGYSKEAVEQLSAGQSHSFLSRYNFYIDYHLECITFTRSCIRLSAAETDNT